jgi:hypothetical protein
MIIGDAVARHVVVRREEQVDRRLGSELFVVQSCSSYVRKSLWYLTRGKH